MDSLHSRVSFYTALSVLVVFISTTLYICWKLTLWREKANELPHSSPRNSILPEQPLLVHTATDPIIPLESVVEQFIQERQRNIDSSFHERQRKIDSARQKEVREANRYLDSIVLAPTSPGWSQSSLYITIDPVCSTISKRSISEQWFRNSMKTMNLHITLFISSFLSFVSTFHIPDLNISSKVKLSDDHSNQGHINSAIVNNWQQILNVGGRCGRDPCPGWKNGTWLV